MKAIAKTSFVRMSPRKLRLVADAVRKLDLEDAIESLKFVNKRARFPLLKTMKQAVANARQKGLSSPLKITKLAIDKGPIYKRWRPVSRGAVHNVQKFTSHITVEVESKVKN